MASETPAAAAPCSDTGTRNAFVTRALELIVQGCSGQKRYKDVKDSCTYALGFLKDGRNATAGPATVMSVCFVPLRIAVESKNAKSIEVAIGCLQKLMEYSFITGDMRWVPPKLEGVDAKWVQLVQAWADSATPLSTPAAGAGGEVAAKTKGESEKRQLIHHVVSCICFNTALLHDGVQLQIIKALLTAVSNPACGVHGSTLVMAVRNTFNSYVQSYHHQNQNTAYAALSHMINSVFRRMEAEGLPSEKKVVPASAEDVTHETANDLDGTVESKTGSDEGNGEGVEAFVRREIVGGIVSDVVGDAAPRDGDVATGEANGDGDGAGNGDGDGAGDEDEDDENFDFDTALAERLAVKAGDIAAASAKENKKPTKVAPGHAGAGGGAGPGHNTSAISPQGVVAASLGRRGSLALTDRSAGGTMTEADADQMVFQNQYQKDAYLLFYAFSALSDKPIADNTADDSLEMKSKMLSLELLLNILHNAGPVFLGSERFVKTVKKKLCLSLIQHCVSPMLPVFRTSLQLFLSLIGKFKDHLKREIGFFFTNVFFPILDSSNSSYQQKVLVLQVVYKVCEAPQTIIDIFINYDCDIQSVNIFETMVHHLSRLLQGRGFTGTGPEALKQERELGTLALKCLVVILRSIVAWTEKFEVASTTDTDVLLGVAGLEASHADEASPLVAPGQGAGAGAGDDATEVSAASPSHTPSASALLPPPMIREASTGNLSNASPAGRGEDEIERARAYKKEMADYIHTFNTKGAKKALQALWAGGVLEENPKAVAEFFKNQPGLSKDQIGEYFGVLKEFNQKCLSDFVELFNFEGLEIDEAVRKFMSSFRIHGEAQTIDATMEKFAETYTKANQATFPNASTAYVLSFSIIMLHTDAHSVSIKTKMTKEEFFVNNRGIDDDKDLPESMLSGIYDRISATPFALEGEDDRPTEASKSKRSTGVFGGGGVFDRAGDGKRRAINFAEESRAMLRKTKALFKSDKGGSKQFLHASKVEHVRPMFEAAWAAMLPAFSVLLERCGADQQDSIDLCVEGFVKSIHIACLFYLDVERDAFVSALSKLTFLNNLREIEPKNIKSIKALISLAVKEGGYLRSSWFAVLRCFSQLERLQLLGSGAKPDFAFIDEPAPDKRGKRGSLRSHHYSHPAADGGGGGGSLAASANGAAPSNASLASTGGSSSGVERALGHHGSAPSAASKEKSAAETERERLRLEERNSAIIADQIDEVAISRVYSSTTELSGEAIVYFVRHLCEVSTEELEQSSPPRIFSLQKLIEIADANMGRIRFVWGQLWTHMSRHFIRVGTNRMLGVSMMGIDSLRQLAIKFLEKRELSNYNFQRDFLKPFEIIFQESQSIEVREFVVRCMEQFVEGKAFRVKSGWKTIFSVLASAASDTNEQIVRLAFGPANSSVTKFFPLVAAADAFVDAVNCLIAFSCNTLSTDIAITAIGHLQTCASALADGVLGMSEEKSEGGKEKEKEYVIRPLGVDDKIDGEDRAQLRVWFPVFTGLGTGATQHPDVSVRLASLNALFAILKAHGSRFTVGMWKVVLSGTVFPIFDNAVCDLCETSTLSAYSPTIAASLSLASAQKHIAQTASASAAANQLQAGGAAAGAPAAAAATNGGTTSSSSSGVTTAEPGAIPGGEKGDTRPAAPTPPSAPLVPTGSSEVPCSPRTQMALESADEALKHMSVIEIGLAYLVDLFTEYYQALRHLMGDVLNIILTCCKRPTPLKVANYGVSALVDLVANHCDVPRDALRHNVAGSSGAAAAAAADGKPGSSSELQRGRGIQRERNPDDTFGEEEWRILATKLTQTFEAKMLGNRSACLLEIKSTSAQDLGRSAAAGGAGRSEMTLPTQASISHLTALLNILTTLSLFVQHLSANWSEETLVTVLGCFQMIHSNPDVLVGGVTSKDVVCLARHCEEKALLLHLRTTLALFVPYTGPERVAGSPSPHSDALRPALYALMRSVLERAAEDRRFDTLANTAVQGLCHLEADEFEKVHSEFYPLLLELITLDAPALRAATKAFFTKVGSQLLRVEGLAPVAFPKARGEGAALPGK